MANVEVGGTRRSVELAAIVDTGFEGDICVPLDVAVTLGLRLVGVDTFELADGSQKRDLLFEGSVHFLGQSHSVAVSLTEGEDALIGTDLMAGCQLFIDFATGDVRLKRKRSQPRGKSK